jgi:hypothetical protein
MFDVKHYSIERHFRRDQGRCKADLRPVHAVARRFPQASSKEFSYFFDIPYES